MQLTLKRLISGQLNVLNEYYRQCGCTICPYYCTVVLITYDISVVWIYKSILVMETIRNKSMLRWISLLKRKQLLFHFHALMRQIVLFGLRVYRVNLIWRLIHNHLHGFRMPDSLPITLSTCFFTDGFSR